SKATTRRSSRETAAAVSLSGTPNSGSRASTSDRFTALISALPRRSPSKRVNGSPTRKAMIADASTTRSPSLTRRLFPAVVDEFLYQIASLGYVAGHDCLGLPKCLRPRSQAQFALPHRFDEEVVTRLQASGGTAFRRDHNTAL